jgi:hypothetical protein
MSIDFQELLGTERFKSSVSEELYVAYQADEEKIYDDLLVQSKEIVRLGWLSGEGYVHLIEWYGFYFTTCGDTGNEGPFETFEDALGGHFDHYVSQPELDSDVLSLDQLKKIALAIVDPNGEEPIEINGAEYELKNGELVEVKE